MKYLALVFLLTILLLNPLFATWWCNECGERNADNSSFCSSCGVKNISLSNVPAPEVKKSIVNEKSSKWFCPACGVENSDKNKFCVECGTNKNGVQPSINKKPNPLYDSERTPNEGHSFGIGVSTSGLSFKFKPDNFISYEGRIYYFDDIGTFGPRVYLNFNQQSKYHFYTGFEADYVTYKYEDIKGSGFALYMPFGTEIMFKDNIGAIFDLGPFYVNLKEDGDNVTNSTFDVMYNLGLNIYF